MKVSKFYNIPENMSLECVSSYLSYALGDHEISVESSSRNTADIVLGGMKIGTLEYDKKLGIRTRSSNEFFEYFFGSPFRNEYEATDGFKWIIQHESGNDNKQISEELSKFSRYDIINPMSLLTDGIGKKAKPLSILPYRDKDGLPVMFTRELSQYQ
jgi:hypothetical protein